MNEFFPFRSQYIFTMVQAWYMDESDSDQRLPHELEPSVPVSLEQLEKLGVLYFNIEVDDAGQYK